MKNFRKRLRALEKLLGLATGLKRPNLTMISVARELDAERAQSGPWIEQRFAQLDDYAGPVIERAPEESLEAFMARVGKIPRVKHPSVTYFLINRPTPPAA